MLSKKERKRLKLEKLRQQSEHSRLEFEQKKQQQSIDQDTSKSKKFKLYTTLIVVFIALFVSVGAYSYINSKKPGLYDDFAQCLTDKGAVMYGASFCQYSHAQKGMFGKSFKNINYKDFSENPDIRVTPTWVFEGEKFERVQSFNRLSELTGCPLN